MQYLSATLEVAPSETGRFSAQTLDVVEKLD